MCVCSMFKRLIGLVLRCAYVPCLSVCHRSGFDVCVYSMFKRLIGLVLRCPYVPCLSV